MQRIHHPPKIFLLFFVLLISLFVPPAVQGQEEDEAQNRAVPGLDVIILVDESETMWNTTDPDGIRVNTVNFFIDVLSTEQSSEGHRVAVIPFGSRPTVIPYVLLDDPDAAERLKSQYAEAHAAIEPTQSLQYTDINAALREALLLVEQDRDPTRKPAILLISDGQPTTPRVSEEKGQEVVETYLAETQSLIEQLNQHEYEGESCGNADGLPFFTIGMGIDKLQRSSTPEFLALYRQFWQGVATQTNGYYREAARLQEMQGISTYIFSELLCTPATPTVTFRESQTLEYQVYKSYYQIIFTISGKENPDLVGQIYRPQADGSPGGDLLRPDEPGIRYEAGPDYEVWRVNFTEPWEGTWQIALAGEGQAEFSYVIFPNVAINLKEPNNGFQPVDRPFDLRANITDETGEPLEVPVSDFQVEIESEDVRKVVSLEPDGTDFAAELEPLGEVGEYSLTFSTILPDGSPLFEHKWVTLISAPWAEITAPTSGQSYAPGEEVPLEAEVHLTGAVPLDGLKLGTTVTQGDEVVQTVELSRGEVVDVGDEERVVTFSGTLPPLDDAGDYEVQAQLMAILPGGRVFDQETGSTPLSIALPPTPTPAPSPTNTPVVTAVEVVPPAAAAEPAPTGLAGLLGGSWWPCLALLLLLLLLAILVFFWRRRQEEEEMPDKIKLLATLMKSRQENGQQPYLLILGSGDSIMLGSDSMRTIVESVAEAEDLEQFHQKLDSFSPVERYSLLKKHFEEARLSTGYRRLAQLANEGYFNLVFTTNLDPFVEKSLASNNGKEPGHQLLICGQQATTETLEALESEEPRVKVVKLHGDVDARNFAFTPSEVSTFGGDSERVLRQYLGHDFIIIGHGSRDYDINRAIEPKGGSIWYINTTPPLADGPLYRAMRSRRAETNIIDGPFGEFDRFFEALYRELMRS